MSEQESTRGGVSGSQGKPSLVASSTACAARSPSILAAMGHEASRDTDSYRDKSQPAGAAHRRLWVVLALLLLGGLLWGLTRIITPATQPPAVKVAVAPNPVVAQEKTAEPVQATTVATVPMSEVGPARLEDTPAIKQADDPKKSDGRAKPGVASHKTSTPPSKKSGSRDTKRAPAVVAMPATPATPLRSPAELDSDVELVSALISHGIEGGSINGAAAAAPPATIASLVQQCRALDAADAVMCRKRICAGYWGKAQACPMSERSASRR